MTHTESRNSWSHRQTQSFSFMRVFPCTRNLQQSITRLHRHFPAAKHQHSPARPAPRPPSLSQSHPHKHASSQILYTDVHTTSHRATHTAPNTSRAHFISNCEQMLLVFINLQTLCCQSLWLPLSLFPTLSLSARRQVSASIFSSSVAVKLNGIGLIAENQREG